MGERDTLPALHIGGGLGGQARRVPAQGTRRIQDVGGVMRMLIQFPRRLFKDNTRHMKSFDILFLYVCLGDRLICCKFAFEVISWPTRNGRTLNYCSGSSVQDTIYHLIAGTAFGRWDHHSVPLLPVYKKTLKTTPTTVRML